MDAISLNRRPTILTHEGGWRAPDVDRVAYPIAEFKLGGPDLEPSRSKALNQWAADHTRTAA
jgi:hypothetical protein